MEVIRTEYLEKLIQAIDQPLIKVITGMRRSGKSTLLKQLRQHLEKNCMTKHAVLITIDKEDLGWDHIQSYHDLHQYIKSVLQETHDRVYLMIDEVQLIDDWQKTVLHWYKDPRFDIYLTGSNAQLLSHELGTLLTGRYLEYHIFPLSFSEHSQFHDTLSRTEAFDRYLRYGGLPALQHLSFNHDLIHNYLQGVFNTIVYRDIVARYGIRKTKTFDKVIHFLSDNIGKIFSNRRVINQLIDNKLSIASETLHEFLGYLENAYVFYKVPRYDAKGKQLLSLYEKYYLGDIGFRSLLVGFNEGDQSGLLENIVYLELCKRGWTVYIGKVGEYEVDFVAMREGKIHYYQVCYRLDSEKTIEREFRSLKMIKDNHPKTVLSLDTVWGDHVDGIKRRNLVEWLLEGE